MMLVLKLPQSPLSEVITTSTVREPSRASSRSASSGSVDGSTRAATPPSTRSIWLANGRAFTMRSWARRSFDAATIFIALVICCVDLTARMRRRMSICEGMLDRAPPRRLLGRLERFAGFPQRRLDLRPELIVEDPLLPEADENRRPPRLDEPVELLLVTLDLGHGDPVQEPVGAGVDEQ